MNSEEKKSDPNWEAIPGSGQPVATFLASDESQQPEKDTAPLLPQDQFLAAEAESARAAIVQTLHDLSADVRVAADVQYWTRLYPWIAVGVATATGFAVGAIATSFGGDMRRVARGRSDSTLPHETAPSKASHEGVASTLLRWLGNLLFDALRTFAGALAASTVQAVTRTSGPASPVSPPDSPEFSRRTNVAGGQSDSAVNVLSGQSAADETIHEP
jgi:hypothetical protein